jgi:DNA-binding Lrp family transcriptional regulator
MSELNQHLLAIIQDGFPLVERPYLRLAEMLNELATNCDSVNNVGEKCANPVVSEQDVFEAVERLRASGVIRRIGGVYDSKKLGFISRLCAGKVPASSLDFYAEPHEQTAMEKFAAAVKKVPGITHNYIRSHEYNVWFTVIAENETAIQTIVDKLCDATDLHDVHVMSATRKFKINTVMRGASAPVVSKQWLVNRDSDEREKTDVIPTKAGISSKDLTASDKLRIRTSCEDIPHSLTPFKDWGVSCDELREDIASKRMRRFGAILRHQNAGFAFNAMVCFRIVDSRKSDKCEDRESHPCLHGYDRDQHLGSIQVGSDERGERCGAAIAPVVSKQWLVNRDSDERRVILIGEAAKDPVKSCDLIAQAGSLLASNLHISHCYERPSFEGFPYNVYAMMHANSAEQLNQYIADCVKSLNELQSSPVDYVVLRSVRELKKTSFKFFA